MKTTKQLANEMADRVFQIRDTYVENKKAKYNRIIFIVKFAAPTVSDAMESSKTISTTAVTSDKYVTTTVKADKTGTVNDIPKEYAEHDKLEEKERVSENVLTANAEIKDPSVTTAVTQAEGKTTVKKTEVSVTNAPVGTTIVTGTDPAETTETSTEHPDSQITVMRRLYSRIDDMDHDNYRSNLTELYKDLYEILDSDYMSDEGRADALTRLHDKEYDMNCLFPRVTDMINGNCSPDAERMTYDLAVEIVKNSESYSKLYWSFMIYTPDIIENVGFSGTREYWLDDHGTEKIVFSPPFGKPAVGECRRHLQITTMTV